MVDMQSKIKSLKDYITGVQNKPKRRYRVSFKYMDLATHHDVEATSPAEALKKVKAELLDDSHMKNVKVQQLGEAWNDTHWGEKTRNIIDATVKALADAKTAEEKRAVVRNMSDKFKVNYYDLYNAIASKTGYDFFN